MEGERGKRNTSISHWEDQETIGGKGQSEKARIHRIPMVYFALRFTLKPEREMYHMESAHPNEISYVISMGFCAGCKG